MSSGALLEVRGILHEDGRADDWQHIAGRNGQLRNSHAYVSAVAVVRQHLHADEWAHNWFAQHGEDDFPDVTARIVAFMEAAKRSAPDGEDVSLDVFETVSDSATPLPDDYFRGPRDRRWKPDADRRALVLDAPTTP